MMRSRSVIFTALVLLCLPLMGSNDEAQEDQPTEYQIKAAFLFRFAMFVEWPERAFAGRTGPLVIGVLGEDPFHDDLPKTIQDKKIDEHPLLVRQIKLPLDATNCHLLFISASEKKRLPEIFQSLKGASVLTVSEVERFTEAGGMINFVFQGARIRFQINQNAATAVGLKISSKLMNVAVP